MTGNRLTAGIGLSSQGQSFFQDISDDFSDAFDFDVSDKQSISALKGLGTGLKAFGAISSYQNTLTNADSQIAAIDVSIAENRRRFGTGISNLRKQATKELSNQKEKFAISGVSTTEGSALDVASDTYYSLLEAEIESSRQLGFQEEQQAVNQSSLRSSKDAAKLQLYASLGTTILGGFSNG